jgi:hypothetical protein
VGLEILPSDVMCFLFPLVAVVNVEVSFYIPKKDNTLLIFEIVQEGP